MGFNDKIYVTTITIGSLNILVLHMTPEFNTFLYSRKDAELKSSGLPMTPTIFELWSWSGISVFSAQTYKPSYLYHPSPVSLSPTLSLSHTNTHTPTHTYKHTTLAAHVSSAVQPLYD